MVRGRGRVDFHPMYIFDLLSDPANKKRWNSQFQELEMIEIIDERLRVRLMGEIGGKRI